MALFVADAFKQFHETINLPGDHRSAANARKDWVLGRLKDKMTVVEAFTFGSIPRFTALEDHADADVLLALHYGEHIRGRQPATVLNNVKTALGGIGTVRRNGQAITVKFQSWPDLDIVPASRVVDRQGKVTRFEIPDSVRGVWLSTKPRLHSRHLEDAASQRGPLFRQIIKMAKDWNRRQTLRLQSYHIEVIALRGVNHADSYPWAMYQWFTEANKALDFYWHEGQDVAQYLTYEQRTRLKQLLNDAVKTAGSAWYATPGSPPNHKSAITQWKSIFGQKFPSYG